MPTTDNIAVLIVWGNVKGEEHQDIIVHEIVKICNEYMELNYRICLFNIHSNFHMERMVGQFIFYELGDGALIEQWW